MTDPISLPTVSEAGDLLRRLARFLKDTPESVQIRFDRLIADIDAGSLRPSYVADVLSTLIRDSLGHTSVSLPTDDDRRRFMHDVVKSIDRIFGDLLRVSKTTQIYASDLKEVWIACEPMLDLVPEPDGFLDIVATALRCKQVRYIYFVSEDTCYKDLVALLTAQGIPTTGLDRLRSVRVPAPYTPPVALYVHETRVVGFRGRGRPPMRRAPDGTWKLVTPLDPGWATMLDYPALHRHYSALTTFLNSAESVP